MKTIIAGSRTCIKYSILCEAIKKIDWKPTVVISGGAKGADKLGELYSKNNNLKLECYPAEWKKYGKSAGYIRNSEMAKNAEALIALWDGVSKGTKHMIELAKKKKLRVLVYKF